MKKYFAIFLVFVLLFATVSCSKEKTETKTEVQSEIALDDTVSRFYWTIGYAYAQMIAESYADFDSDAFIQGAVDYKNSNQRLSDEEQEEAYTAYMYGDNLKEAEEFLASNAQKEGVVKTESGLQYQVITPGNGVKPTAEDTVVVDYKLTLIDGTLADQGIDAELPIPQLIPGMIEALCLMDVGSTYRLWIHPDLGYGQYGGGYIPGNSLLIFDVTLNAIK